MRYDIKSAPCAENINPSGRDSERRINPRWEEWLKLANLAQQQGDYAAAAAWMRRIELEVWR